MLADKSREDHLSHQIELHLSSTLFVCLVNDAILSELPLGIPDVTVQQFGGWASPILTSDIQAQTHWS